MEELYKQLDSAPPLPTEKVNERVSSENAKLKAEIEEAQQKMQKATESERAMGKDLEAARRKATFPNKSWWPSGVHDAELKKESLSESDIVSLINRNGHDSIVEVI